ncbi:hypothetical protein [Halocatena pleomorpha]|uniref:Uncharacterized protein n=1 Tax=Halocatena pleomorpha TaxID=1785090 RepID=A0A3P3R7Y0_9EURY|nr:hypothetical protein [Halocatena pleomorpha]RRJ29536.1 hypothetical protein EIK79_12940 [Halocatena pleomorpha]
MTFTVLFVLSWSDAILQLLFTAFTMVVSAVVAVSGPAETIFDQPTQRILTRLHCCLSYSGKQSRVDILTLSYVVNSRELLTYLIAQYCGVARLKLYAFNGADRDYE